MRVPPMATPALKTALPTHFGQLPGDPRVNLQRNPVGADLPTPFRDPF